MQDQTIERALQLHQAGQLEAAEVIYREILAATPDHPDALHLLGVLAFQCGQHEQAIQLIERATQVAPNNASFYGNLAEVYRSRGRLKEAIATCQMALQLQPDYIDAHNNLASALIDNGDFAQAERELRDVLRKQPELAVAHNNLGNALREQDERDEALEAYREAVRVAPECPEAQANLGQMLLEEGEVDEALAHCEAAVRLRPNFAEALSNLGNVLRQQGKLDEAKQRYQAALELNPNIAMIYGNIGQAWQEEGRYDDAVQWYQQAIMKDPQETRFHCFLASTLADQDKFDQAIARLELALRIDPECLAAHNGLGGVYQEQGEFKQAIDWYEKSLKLDDEQAFPRVCLGHLHEILGDFEQAENYFRAAIEQNPKAAGAYAALSSHHNEKLSGDDLAELRKLLEEPYLGDAQRATMYYALATDADADGRYDEAADLLSKANSHSKVDRTKRGEAYDPDQHDKFVDGLIETFSKDFFVRAAEQFTAMTEGRSIRDGQLAMDAPIFIVGLPRSGTTLTEQILASHPHVFGAGELPFAGEAFKSIPLLCGLEATALECLRQLPATSDNVLQQAAAAHLQKLRKLDARALRIADKMPDNYLYLGLLAAMFPQAKFIHCRRDVRDVAVSHWVTNFKSIGWACETDHIARRIQQYQRLMQHWREVLPVPLLEIDYEQTVTDLENTARRLVDFVGLDWDAACLAPHKTERPIRTASVSQVRQPVYRSSVGRWQNYAKTLSHLFNAIETRSVSEDAPGDVPNASRTDAAQDSSTTEEESESAPPTSPSVVAL